MSYSDTAHDRYFERMEKAVALYAESAKKEASK